jgi:hypothetical protein
MTVISAYYSNNSVKFDNQVQASQTNKHSDLTQYVPTFLHENKAYAFSDPRLLMEALSPQGTLPLTKDEISVIRTISRILSSQLQSQLELSPTGRRDFFLASFFDSITNFELNEVALISVLNRMVNQKLLYLPFAQKIIQAYLNFKNEGQQAFSSLPTFQQNPLGHILSSHSAKVDLSKINFKKLNFTPFPNLKAPDFTKTTSLSPQKISFLFEILAGTNSTKWQKEKQNLSDSEYMEKARSQLLLFERFYS